MQKKVMTKEKESVVHSADENVKLLYTCTHHTNVKQSDTGAQCFLKQCSLGSNYPEGDTIRPVMCGLYH